MKAAEILKGLRKKANVSRPAQASKAANETVELRPDGWKDFEGAVDVAMKTPPKPRVAKGKPKGRSKAKKTAKSTA